MQSRRRSPEGRPRRGIEAAGGREVPRKMSVLRKRYAIGVFRLASGLACGYSSAACGEVQNSVWRSNRRSVENAARLSDAARIVQRMPMGFEQVVGSTFSKGINLSGGEWQRLALARTYMRDAQLIILDEPSAALDAHSESVVFRQLAELTRRKAAILISHRFSTIRMADRILVLDRGQLREEGTHDELLNRKGRYSELFEVQAAGYK